jgi:hypothetical protein
VFLLRTAFATLLAALLVVVAAIVVALAPLWTGPPLPAGATRLHIATASGPGFGCTAALLAPVRIAASDDDLIVIGVASGEPVPVVWPSGFAAWRIDGRAVLAGPYGNVIGREGDVLDDLGGGGGPDGLFHVCGFGAGFGGLLGAPFFLVGVSVALGAVLIVVPWTMVKRRRDVSGPRRAAE